MIDGETTMIEISMGLVRDQFLVKLEENLGQTNPTASFLFQNETTKLLFVGFVEGTIQIYSFSPESIQLQGTLNGHSNAISGMVSKDGKYLVSCSCDGTLKFWEVNSKKLLTTASGHTNAVYSVVYSADSKMIFSGSRDKTIRVWNNQGICKKQIPLNSECKVVKECGNKLYYADDTNLCEISLDNFNFKPKVVITMSQAIETLEISPDASLAFVVYSNMLALVDIGEGKVLSTWKIDAGPNITGVVVNPTKYQIALSGTDQAMSIDLEIRQVLSASPPHAPITSLLWDNTGEHLLTTHSDGYLRIWSSPIIVGL